MIPAAGDSADVCLILEGAYPYITGGVSSWAHELIRDQAHLRFHLLTLVADDAPRQLRFELPPNVVGLQQIVLQAPTRRATVWHAPMHLFDALEQPLTRLFNQGGRDDFAEIVGSLDQHRSQRLRTALLDSEPAFDMLQRMYESAVPGTSFLNYFWSWRSLAGGLFSVLLAPLPRARLYHAVSTGYAGLAMARAVLETGRAGLLTEHGIYTNERRVEIAMADWLVEQTPTSLNIDSPRRALRDVWIDAFAGYARTCYECCSVISTLYAGNQALQLRDGAPPERLAVIPNGIDVEALAGIVRDPASRRPTVALIGRVVPIKDVQTYIRAAALLRQHVPDVLVLMLGPTDEDPAYFTKCRDLVAHLGLDDTFEFRGRVNLHDYLGRIDAIVLTSISEAQPLVLLEAGAAGVPAVATDVGCCREILLGAPDEEPPLGEGGIVTPLSNPMATAQALATLLLDPPLRTRQGQILQRRVRRYYDRRVIAARYRALYDAYLSAPQRPVAVPAGD